MALIMTIKHTRHVIAQKRLNLTRTVRKLPINENMERAGHYIHDDRPVDIKYDEHEVGLGSMHWFGCVS